MEHHRLHPRSYVLLNSQNGGRNPIDETHEPKQDSEIHNVLSSHMLYYRVHSMRHLSLAAM